MEVDTWTIGWYQVSDIVIDYFNLCATHHLRKQGDRSVMQGQDASPYSQCTDLMYVEGTFRVALVVMRATGVGGWEKTIILSVRSSQNSRFAKLWTT